MPVRQGANFFGGQTQDLADAVDNDKIIAQSMHFAKT
jgi:hypothetical protein